MEIAMNIQNAVATASYRDTWAGVVVAYLVPQKTTRSGVRVTVYRWMRDNGMAVDGMAHGRSAEYMIQHAKRHALFGDVALADDAQAVKFIGIDPEGMATYRVPAGFF